MLEELDRLKAERDAARAVSDLPTYLIKCCEIELLARAIRAEMAEKLG